MDDILYRLHKVLASSKSPQETLSTLQICISLLTDFDAKNVGGELPALFEELLSSVIKPLFIGKISTSLYRVSSFESPRKLWRDSAPWVVVVLEWILNNYGSLDVSILKPTIEQHFTLLIPPILTMLDDDELVQKKTGCDLLHVLCTNISTCESTILKRTGMTKVFEDSLAPSMLMLPSLTTEEDSLRILGSLYPAYRALIKASSPARFSAAPPNCGKLIPLLPQRRITSRDFRDQTNARQVMLDRMLRGGILAGYIHASDHVQIATLLVSETSHTIAMMGTSSAKYLSQLLPLLRDILTNPLAAAHQALLLSAIATMRELLIHCRSRFAQIWWEECLRAIIGLWLLLCEEEDSLVQRLKAHTKELMTLLLQMRGQSETERDLNLLQAECQQLETLVSES